MGRQIELVVNIIWDKHMLKKYIIRLSFRKSISMSKHVSGILNLY